MRDRLIELIDDFIRDVDVSHWYSDELDEKLADHLLANGVIVPPCKEGDTMYCDGKLFADHCQGEIMSFPVDIVRTEVCSTFRGEIDMIFEFNDFGKKVFLTKEEAEKALERSGE